MKKRLIWALSGWVSGTIAVVILRYAVGKPLWFLTYSFPVICGSVFLWVGERKGKVPTGEEVNRPISIFSKHRGQ